MMEAKRKMRRIGGGTLVVLTLGWLAFIVYLDVAYDMFPRVLLGGMKILVAAYLLLFLALGVVFAARALLRRLAGRAKA
jgi:hypothetical protein